MPKLNILTYFFVTAGMAVHILNPVYAQNTITTEQGSPITVNPIGVEAINLVLDELSEELLKTLPESGTYAIKRSTDTSAGVPEDLLAQLTNSLQSSIMVASKFEINLIDLGEQELAWSNAMEFNGADFEEMFENSGFSAIIILQSRATAVGIELSLKAIGATTENAGSVIAITQAKSVAIDWSSVRGNDLTVSTLDKIKDVQAQIEQLKGLTAPIENPESFAEFIFNARIYQQLGETEKAIVNYTDSIKIANVDGLPFIDPLIEVIELTTARYGEDGAKMFAQKKILPIASPVAKDYLNVRFSFITDAEQRYKIVSQTMAPIAVALWASTTGGMIFKERIERLNPNSRLYGHSNLQVDYLLLMASRTVQASFNNAYFEGIFIDDAAPLQMFDRQFFSEIERALNRVEVSIFSSEYSYGGGDLYLDPTYQQTTHPRHVRQNVSHDFDKSIIDYTSSVRKSVSVNPSAMSDMLIDTNFAQTGWCIQSRFSPMDDFWSKLKRIDALEISDVYWTDEGFTVPPISVLTDRVVWGDLCSSYRYHQGQSPTEGTILPIWGLHNLIVTDSVDRTKPIILTLETEKGCTVCLPTVEVDITKDGTYFWEHGTPMATYFQPTDAFVQSFHSVENYDRSSCNNDGCSDFGSPIVGNGWAYAPGIVQSSIYARRLISVSYTAIDGASRSIDNIYYNISGHVIQDLDGSQWETASYVDAISSASKIGYSQAVFGSSNVDIDLSAPDQSPAVFDEWKESLWANFFVPMISNFSRSANGDVPTQNIEDPAVALKNLGTCFPAPSLAYIPHNVSEYVSLRLEPSSASEAIERIYSGVALARADSTTYIGQASGSRELCYSLCNNESSGLPVSQDDLMQCIDDNGLWYKLQTSSGAIGYISAKFLAIGP